MSTFKEYQDKIVFGPLPDKARHVAATGIIDLKHALDQAACAAFQIVTGREPDGVYFPFATNPKDLRGRLAKMMPPELHPVLEGFQAYPTGPGHPGGSDHLCTLSKVANQKHRISCGIGHSINEIGGEGWSATHAVTVYFPFPKWDGENGELIFAVVKPHGDFRANLRGTMQVGFEHAGAFNGEAVDAVLKELATIVEGIVLGLEAETERIVSSRAS